MKIILVNHVELSGGTLLKTVPGLTEQGRLKGRVMG